MLYKPELERCQFVCNKCNHHMRIGARQRLDYFLLHGEGTDLKMNVPSNPKNWGSKHFANKKFTDDPEYKSFINEKRKINLLLKNFK